MATDVKAEVSINGSREDVAKYAMNLDPDAVWISGISEAKMLTVPPVDEGTRVSRVASFLRRRIDYALEVVRYQRKSLLAMRSIKSLFPDESHL